MTKINTQGEVAQAVVKHTLPALLGKDAIKSAQDGIRVSLVKLDQSIHENAVQCLMHAEKHGDTSLMTRLLVDIVDAKSGYRRQGLIAWMRSYTPMELKGNTINLSGVDKEGQKRPWRVAEADANPFRADDTFKEAAKPLFQDSLLGPVEASYKRAIAAMENTVNGKPVDASKPFYAGTNGDKVVDFWTEVLAKARELPADSTREVYLARQQLADAQATIDAADKAELEAQAAAQVKGQASVAA